MIAQKWSTGYIPRFEILHKHEALNCQKDGISTTGGIPWTTERSLA
jgi:hypothetical protein